MARYSFLVDESQLSDTESEDFVADYLMEGVSDSEEPTVVSTTASHQRTSL